MSDIVKRTFALVLICLSVFAVIDACYAFAAACRVNLAKVEEPAEAGKCGGEAADTTVLAESLPLSDRPGLVSIPEPVPVRVYRRGSMMWLVVVSTVLLIFLLLTASFIMRSVRYVKYLQLRNEDIEVLLYASIFAVFSGLLLISRGAVFTIFYGISAFIGAIVFLFRQSQKTIK